MQISRINNTSFGLSITPSAAKALVEGYSDILNKTSNPRIAQACIDDITYFENTLGGRKSKVVLNLRDKKTFELTTKENIQNRKTGIDIFSLYSNETLGRLGFRQIKKTLNIIETIASQVANK